MSVRVRRLPLRKNWARNISHLRLLSSVSANMPLRVNTLYKLGTTHITYIRFLASVSTNIMLHQTTTECKLGTTSITFMRSLYRVNEHSPVPLQDSTLCKQGATNVASIRFHSSVSANMILQMVTSYKTGRYTYHNIMYSFPEV